MVTPAPECDNGAEGPMKPDLDAGTGPAPAGVPGVLNGVLLAPGPAADAAVSRFSVACAAAAAAGVLKEAPGIPGTIYTVPGAARPWPEVALEADASACVPLSGGTALPVVFSGCCGIVPPEPSTSSGMLES